MLVISWSRACSKHVDHLHRVSQATSLFVLFLVRRCIRLKRSRYLRSNNTFDRWKMYFMRSQHCSTWNPSIFLMFHTFENFRAQQTNGRSTYDIRWQWNHTPTNNIWYANVSYLMQIFCEIEWGTSRSPITLYRSQTHASWKAVLPHWIEYRWINNSCAHYLGTRLSRNNRENLTKVSAENNWFTSKPYLVFHLIP